MTPHSPSQHPPYQLATRTRVKWDNIAIVLFGVVVAAFAVVWIMASGDTTPTTPKSAPAQSDSTAAIVDEPTGTDGSLSMEDSQALVEEARAFMTEARWDEAADRLTTVPAEFRELVGADSLQTQLDTTRATHDRLRAELGAAVEARQWKQAKVLLAQLSKIAALDEPLLETQALVDNSLQPAAAKAPRPATSADRTNATTATGGGGHTSANHAAATKPSGTTTTTKPKPRPGAPRPSATSGGGSPVVTPPASTTPTNTSTGTGTGTSNATGTANGTSAALAGAMGGMQLTAAQQQELEDALAAAFGGANFEDF